jgi:hypothetical protein
MLGSGAEHDDLCCEEGGATAPQTATTQASTSATPTAWIARAVA